MVLPSRCSGVISHPLLRIYYYSKRSTAKLLRAWSYNYVARKGGTGENDFMFKRNNFRPAVAGFGARSLTQQQNIRRGKPQNPLNRDKSYSILAHVVRTSASGQR